MTVELDLVRTDRAQPFVSEMDLQEAHLPKETIRFLTDTMSPGKADVSAAQESAHIPAGMDCE